jgi:hypothetical protein
VTPSSTPSFVATAQARVRQLRTLGAAGRAGRVEDHGGVAAVHRRDRVDGRRRGRGGRVEMLDRSLAAPGRGDQQARSRVAEAVFDLVALQ